MDIYGQSHNRLAMFAPKENSKIEVESIHALLVQRGFLSRQLLPRVHHAQLANTKSLRQPWLPFVNHASQGNSSRQQRRLAKSAAPENIRIRIVRSQQCVVTAPLAALLLTAVHKRISTMQEANANRANRVSLPQTRFQDVCHVPLVFTKKHPSQQSTSVNLVLLGLNSRVLLSPATFVPQENIKTKRLQA
jgi:hypothetical protein